MGYERPFPTYLALGGIFPINSNEGQRTPMVIVDHEPGGRKSGLLKASLHAAVRQASYTHQPSAVAELKYGSRLTLFAEGSGGDLYRKEGGISPKKTCSENPDSSHCRWSPGSVALAEVAAGQHNGPLHLFLVCGAV